MGKLIYSMSISLDGYIAGPDGSFDWSVPSEELHRFHNERTRERRRHRCVFARRLERRRLPLGRRRLRAVGHPGRPGGARRFKWQSLADDRHDRPGCSNDHRHRPAQPR